MINLVSVFIIGLFLGIGLCDRLSRRQAKLDRQPLPEVLAELDRDITRVSNKFKDIREGQ